LSNKAVLTVCCGDEDIEADRSDGLGDYPSSSPRPLDAGPVREIGGVVAGEGAMRTQGRIQSRQIYFFFICFAPLRIGS